VTLAWFVTDLEAVGLDVRHGSWRVVVTLECRGCEAESRDVEEAGESAVGL
jgi:hypothetical protein